MADLTISTSGIINPVSLSALEVITITGAGVTVSTPDGLGLSLLDDFTIENNAVLDLNSTLDVSATDNFAIGSHGTLELANGLGVNLLTDISFMSGASGGELMINEGPTISAFSGVSGFNYGDIIDFVGAGTPINGTVTTSAGLGTTNFTIATSSGTQTFELNGNYTGDTFSAAADGRGGFDFSDDTPCFVQGTRILTLQGELPVERLAIGDTVVLATGRTAPIIFIGHRSVNPARHRRPEAARPIRISADALELGVPCRDLMVSPDHALFIDGVLIPARNLVDGLLIRQEPTNGPVTYYHVELEEHGILLADGAPAESFVNVGHRGMFENSNEPIVLHPERWAAERERRSCAPLVTGGPELAAIRHRLHACALAQGYAIVEQSMLSLELDKQSRLTPCTAGDGWQVFTIPEGTTKAVLESPVFCPAETDPASSDRRTLGIALAGAAINGQAYAVEDVIDPEQCHPRGDGEVAIWTNGPAHLNIPHGTKTISLLVAGWPRRWAA